MPTFKRNIYYHQVFVISLSTWVYGAVFAAIPLLGLHDIHYAPEGFLTTCRLVCAENALIYLINQNYINLFLF